MDNVEFTSNLSVVIKATDAAMQRAAEIIGGMMESNAKLYVTDTVYTNDAKGWYIRTGDLRDRLNHRTVEEDGKTVVVVGSPMEYAPYVELGTGIHAEDGKGRKTPWRYQDDKGNWHTTSGMPARPFLRPAVEKHLEDYKRVLESELKKP